VAELAKKHEEISREIYQMIKRGLFRMRKQMKRELKFKHKCRCIKIKKRGRGKIRKYRNEIQKQKAWQKRKKSGN